jgi:hypothetical protein
MFCPNCGKKNPDDAKFCDGCGTTLGDQPAAAPVSPPASAPAAAPAPLKAAVPPPAPLPPVYAPPAQPAYNAPPPAYYPPPAQQAFAPEDLNKPMSIGAFIGTYLLLAVPLLNIFLLFKWAFGSNVNRNKKNLARAILIISLIVIAIMIAVSILFAGFWPAIMDYFSGLG